MSLSCVHDARETGTRRPRSAASERHCRPPPGTRGMAMIFPFVLSRQDRPRWPSASDDGVQRALRATWGAHSSARAARLACATIMFAPSVQHAHSRVVTFTSWPTVATTGTTGTIESAPASCVSSAHATCRRIGVPCATCRCASITCFRVLRVGVHCVYHTAPHVPPWDMIMSARDAPPPPPPPPPPCRPRRLRDKLHRHASTPSRGKVCVCVCVYVLLQCRARKRSCHAIAVACTPLPRVRVNTAETQTVATALHGISTPSSPPSRS